MKKRGNNNHSEEIIRVRIPKKEEHEVIGVVEKLLGANKMKVRCMDGVVRTARIVGKIKKRVWIREGDVVIVVPWDFQDEKGDVVWKYKGQQVNWLQSKGYLKN